ncbi:hypothetical protein, partial [Mycobacterium intracellulare]|uniref:hypothetical protein n=1 Tax=Mycobacterium intracellulare TaxID=1767 RepID=UPI001CDAF534
MAPDGDELVAPAGAMVFADSASLEPPFVRFSWSITYGRGSAREGWSGHDGGSEAVFGAGH